MSPWRDAGHRSPTWQHPTVLTARFFAAECSAALRSLSPVTCWSSSSFPILSPPLVFWLHSRQGAWWQGEPPGAASSLQCPLLAPHAAAAQPCVSLTATVKHTQSLLSPSVTVGFLYL